MVGGSLGAVRAGLGPAPSRVGSHGRFARGWCHGRLHKVGRPADCVRTSAHARTLGVCAGEGRHLRGLYFGRVVMGVSRWCLWQVRVLTGDFVGLSSPPPPPLYHKEPGCFWRPSSPEGRVAACQGISEARLPFPARSSLPSGCQAPGCVGREPGDF